MPDFTLPVQQALYARLVPVFAPVPLYDHVPQGADFPYVTLGDIAASDASDKTHSGQDMTLTLHAWSRTKGRKEIWTLLGKAYAALHDHPLIVPGAKTLLLTFDLQDSFRDEDGRTWHGLAQYRLLLSATS